MNIVDIQSIKTSQKKEKKVIIYKYFCLNISDSSPIQFNFDNLKIGEKWHEYFMRLIAYKSYIFICGWIEITPEM